MSFKWKEKKNKHHSFFTHVDHICLSNLPISARCQRRVWITSQALCLFIFCKKGQLPQQCQSTSGSLICESLTVWLLPAQLVHRCVCECMRACVCVCAGGVRCLNRTQISDSFFFFKFLINKTQCMLGYVWRENNMPLVNQKQVVVLGGFRACNSYHKTTTLLTLIVVVDRFWGLGQKCFITWKWNQSIRNVIMLKAGNHFVVMDSGQVSC